MKRTASLVRRHPLRPSGKPLPAVGKGLKGRRQRYAAHLRSPYFRALRLERFKLDGWRCTGPVRVMRQTSDVKWPESETESIVRCSYRDETETGKGLHAHHTSYRNLGRESVDQLVTMCNDHHRLHHAGDWWKVRP